MSAAALDTARCYHDAWTNDRYGAAAKLLAPDLEIEVPVNDYPTREAFAEAVENFGSMTTQVDLLSEVGSQDEAMLLYDMTVSGLGTMRVAEHFTVADGRIVRLRQVHDTAALRQAGFVADEAG